jgi:hypothetical protein
MELFCALLAGFFFWAFMSHLQRFRRMQVHEIAGPLVLEVHAAEHDVQNASYNLSRSNSK